MNKCNKCNFEWKPRVSKPRRCPYCLSYKWCSSGTYEKPRESAPQSKEVNIPGHIDVDRDVYKLTRTPKSDMAMAMSQLREAYYQYPEVAELIITKALEAKKAFAQENAS